MGDSDWFTDSMFTNHRTGKINEAGLKARDGLAKIFPKDKDTALDWVPGVGAANRFEKGDIGAGGVDLALDVLTLGVGKGIAKAAGNAARAVGEGLGVVARTEERAAVNTAQAVAKHAEAGQMVRNVTAEANKPAQDAAARVAAQVAKDAAAKKAAEASAKAAAEAVAKEGAAKVAAEAAAKAAAKEAEKDLMSVAVTKPTAKVAAENAAAAVVKGATKGVPVKAFMEGAAKNLVKPVESALGKALLKREALLVGSHVLPAVCEADPDNILCTTLGWVEWAIVGAAGVLTAVVLPADWKWKLVGGGVAAGGTYYLLEDYKATVL